MHGWSARIAHFAFTPSSTAARRRSRVWCSGSTAAAPAAASPIVSRRRNATQTIEYLRGREQVTMVYREAWRSVWLESDPKQRVRALCYMVDRGHVQYAGRLTLAEQVRFVRQGHGRSGINRDYVIETVKAIEALGYRDTGCICWPSASKALRSGPQLQFLRCPLPRSAARSRFRCRPAVAR